MPETYLIGLDFGSESARGVLIDIGSGRQCAYHVHPYRHGIMTRTLPGGRELPAGFALQNAPDYLEAAETILKAIGAGRDIAAIGVDFTASSPLPALADGRSLSEILPDEPHAYVKLWKHARAQRYAEAISRRGGSFLNNFGGRVSGEWMLAKAAQIAAEAPDVWRRCEKFIEGGDWLVWRLTGREVRSLDFAAYKAQYAASKGYPANAVEGLTTRLSTPDPVGSPAGPLTAEWRAHTGIRGEAIVSVAVINSMSPCQRLAPMRRASSSGRSVLRRRTWYSTMSSGRCRRGLKGAHLARRCRTFGATRRVRRLSATCSRGSCVRFPVRPT